MFVALDITNKRAVSGFDIANCEEHQIPCQHDEVSYRCLYCGSALEYTRHLNPDHFNYFTHPDQRDCINDGNISGFHRLGQEVVTKELINWLPNSHELAQVEFERRIGSNSDFVIADLCVTNPVQVVIEIVYLSNKMSLRRRLRTLFEQGYAVMLVVLINAEISPSRIEHHMKKVAAIEVGRFNPFTLALEFGSLFTPDEIDPDASEWEDIPAYLS